MVSVDFFFGPGSRYSYLAATQLASISAQTGAAFRWRAIFSGDLIQQAGGGNPFSPDNQRGQYTPAYRSTDAERWASHYGVQYREPDFENVDWRLIALWCAGSELIGDGFGGWVLASSFEYGVVPSDSERLRAGADQVGLDGATLARLVANGEAASRHALNLTDGLQAGAFGVPTFVCPDGETFWGQDRIPLLVDHLIGRRSG